MQKVAILNKENLNRLYWIDKLSLQEIAQRYNVHLTSVLKRMKKFGIPRRNFSEANYVFHDGKPKYKIKTILNDEEEKLKIAGVMLYWAEGYKGGMGIDFANSDPDMIRLFLKFLRQICGIGESRLRVYLYAYEDQNIDALKDFWSKITQIPLVQFSKPYIRKHNLCFNGRKMPYGLIHIRYYDKRLGQLVLSWVESYKRSFETQFYGQVPKRPNGTDCEKRSVLKKFRMEKRVNSGEPSYA
jgi:predicted DNA-binding protein YlxM (UPF0122 family)